MNYAEFFALYVAKNHRGYEKSGYDEEYVDTNIATAECGYIGMKKNDRQNSERS